MTHIRFPESDEKEIELLQEYESSSGKTLEKSYPFTFDKVFVSSMTQNDVFDEISQLVQSALDGYRVCIFAYGQTGSGKTYTMEGPSQAVLNNDKSQIGMIPRAVHQIFATAEDLKSKGWEYTMEASFLEIYNETIRDLLGNGDLNKKHEIKHNIQNLTSSVTDLTVLTVTNEQKVFSLLKKASENRAVGETQCNERSSRSHRYAFSLI